MTPRGSQNKAEVVDDQVKVWVTAAPTDGQANDAVCRLIADRLDVAPSAVSVKRGQTSREKTLAISGLDLETAMARLRQR